MSVVIEVTNVPPYCGVPRLSHQCPVGVVVTVVVPTADVVVDVVTVVTVADVEVVVDVLDIGLVVVVDVVDDFTHDAKINDVTMRQVSSTQIIPLFITPPFILTYLRKSFSMILFPMSG